MNIEDLNSNRLIYKEFLCILLKVERKNEVKMRIFRNSAYSLMLNVADKSAPDTRKLYVRSAGYCGADCNFREKPRKISFGCFYWFVGGSAVFTMGKRDYLVKQGEVWFYPPGSMIDFRPQPEGAQYFWMALYGDILMPLCESLNIPAGRKVCGMPPEEMLQDLISAVRYSTPDQRLEVLQLGMNILFRIASPKLENPAAAPTLAQEARSIIEKEFHSPKFGVAILAHRLGVHPVTLCREFKKEFQMTPSDFITNRRMRKAAEMLETQHYPIKQISGECGFASPEYFATVFASKFGIAPSKFAAQKNKGGC